jgi:hypothetical protein
MTALKDTVARARDGYQRHVDRRPEVDGYRRQENIRRWDIGGYLRFVS